LINNDHNKLKLESIQNHSIEIDKLRPVILLYRKTTVRLKLLNRKTTARIELLNRKTTV